VYRAAAKVDKPDVIPYYGEWTIEANSEYEHWLYILTSLG